MTEVKRYSIGDLKECISKASRIKSDKKISVRESKDEFEPVFGDNVQKDNKKINSDAYKEITKETESYDGGLTNKKNNTGESVLAMNNRGMSDLRYDSISKPFKDKVKAQLKGYPSADAEKKHKNDEFGNAFYDSDKMSDKIASHAKEVKREIDSTKTDGLTSSKHKTEIEKENETMFESKKITKIQFKNTEFLSEAHMLTKVPDEFKVEGKRFMMKDTAGNEYIVEWTNRDPNVTKNINMMQVNEQMGRIKELYGYRSKDYFKSTNAQHRINENKGFSDMLDRARKLMK